MSGARISRRLIWGLILGALAVISCIAYMTYATWRVPESYWEDNPVWSPDGQAIAFECHYGRPDLKGFYDLDGYEICVAGANGEGFLRLTTNDYSDQDPVWSPDGKRIAFISSEFAAKEYTRRITLMNRDGSHLTDLAEGGGAPSWSPDGRYIVYRDVRGNLAVVNAQSGEVTSLEGDGSRGGGFGPVWSPDGQHIAFTAYTSYLNGHEEIYVVAADGTDETRLTYGATHSSNPTWSPDGKRIAFSSLKDFRPEETGSGYWAIELMDADGSNRVQLTRHESGWATWTPDGQHLIFPHYYDDKTSMFVIGVDGGAETQLATLPWSGELSFSPDRQRVALVREGIPITVHSKRIWIAAVDGSSETRLTRQE